MERIIELRFKILNVPRKNINNVREPTLKEKLVRQKSSRERGLIEEIRSAIRKPRPK